MIVKELLNRIPPYTPIIIQYDGYIYNPPKILVSRGRSDRILSSEILNSFVTKVDIGKGSDKNSRISIVISIKEIKK